MPSSAPVTTETSSIGRRDRKRQRTRATIMRAAYELIQERGYKNVTINEIATKADVDPTTFWRHFGSKEAVLFEDPMQIIARMEAELEARPAEEDVLTAALNAVQVLVSEHDRDGELARARIQIAETVPEVRQLAGAIEQDGVRVLAVGLARRLGLDAVKDFKTYVLASLVVAAVRRVRGEALQQGRIPTNAEVFRRVRQLIVDTVSLIVPT